MFGTLMYYERHNTKIAFFGGKPGLNMEYKGELFLSWTAKIGFPRPPDR
jgi:hypothetical protein